MAVHYKDEEGARAWFYMLRWPNGICCPFCTSDLWRPARKDPTRYWCYDCQRPFNLKINTALHHSKAGFQQWALVVDWFVSIQGEEHHADFELPDYAFSRMWRVVEKTYGLYYGHMQPGDQLAILPTRIADTAESVGIALMRCHDREKEKSSIAESHNDV